MKRLALLLVLVAGCARSNGALVFAVDPLTGICTPVSAADRDAVAGWQPCNDPCAALGERACKSDTRCQLTSRPSGNTCHAVPQQIDPCKGLDAVACANDVRCGLEPIGSGCDCAAGVVCDCPAPPPPTCALKPCSTVADADACNARVDCTTSPPPPVPTPVASGAAQPRSLPATACFPIEGCGGLDEQTCAKRHECVEFYDDHDDFYCGGFADRCMTTDDCPLGQRCDVVGQCVVEGCAGEIESECNADARCLPVYSLDCSPYANGGPVPDSFCGGTGGGGSGGGNCGGGGVPAPGPCEPTFTRCQDSPSVVAVGKSVLVRDPAILDDPYWSLPRALTQVTGAADASVVADAWLAQLGATTAVDGKTSAARPGAAQYFAALPHRADGLLDATQLGFVPTALSNRLDLTDTTSCGEARITYALAAGVGDRRHRMTVIVELRQPYDGARCRATAQRWVDLGKLDGAALQAALQSLYAPLLTPANLKQVRTNEFLVGPQDPTLPKAAWELREFHLGADARLHQTLLPLQIDGSVASSPDFLAWAQTASPALARGTVTFPVQYQVAIGSEDGTRIALPDTSIADLVNQSTCVGCHTTATNSAFAHVAERFGGTGGAEISQFLVGELQKRATHLANVAAGVAGAALDVRPLH